MRRVRDPVARHSRCDPAGSRVAAARSDSCQRYQGAGGRDAPARFGGYRGRVGQRPADCRVVGTELRGRVGAWRADRRCGGRQLRGNGCGGAAGIPVGLFSTVRNSGSGGCRDWRRDEERHRDRGRRGGVARARRQLPVGVDHPRSGGDFPARFGTGRAAGDAGRTQRSGRSRADLYRSAQPQPLGRD
ncbi:hypothetical protein GBAR_LOCUS27260 [Geodia barretti]|nr:hypothetical protein GBAR_LOCUS27260 [Geodia barretti]